MGEGKKSKGRNQEEEDPGVEKEVKHSSGFCFGHFARAATLLSLKT